MGLSYLYLAERFKHGRSCINAPLWIESQQNPSDSRPLPALMHQVCNDVYVLLVQDCVPPVRRHK